jgi:hypothetical protein
MKIEDHNLGLPDQQFSDPTVEELVTRARLDEAEWFMDGLKPMAPGWGINRVDRLRKRARVLVDKNEGNHT